ncbi:MAG: TlyA family RNA methyltransferase [Leptospiraceae bacterium]|nr:TlyA family RNA methyltransferase [Leptospiraceae bacterium]MDW7975676.1 TlyA family RNA methyltransferase [Leptospiraceae bacterium]
MNQKTKKTKKERIDKILVEKGLVESRQKAQVLILKGEVYVNNQKIQKASTKISYDDEIIIKQKEKFVSRGGYKLEKAILTFQLDVRDKVCMDIGASTGGFTDCLLQYGARKVYAIDVGENLLHEKLKNHPNVISIENTNARYLTKEIIPEPIDFFCSDVSFISQTKILVTIKELLHHDSSGVALVKPQFELSKKEVKNGIVKDPVLHKKAIEIVINQVIKLGYYVNALTVSPILGAKGNREFLILLSFSQKYNIPENEINKIVFENA